ncbi:MAG: UDP-N-acetylmuramoyl-L-alanine--D-glutamate ligase [Candidatus Omnitrophota bacterium]
MDLRNKKITVVGLGNSGFHSALLLDKEGAIVSVTDDGSDDLTKERAKILRGKYIDCEIGCHTEEFLNETELLVVSPGVPDSSLPIRCALERNIPIISELELGYIFCKGKIIAITGTNGKSTVVSLLGDILKKAKLSVNVCGNIGNSLSGEAAKIKKETIAVVEVSSFQLERIREFRPNISAILNIAEDHLDRHPDFKSYVEAKKNIFKNQKKGDFTILNFDDKDLKKIITRQKIESNVLYFSAKKKVKGIFLEKEEVKLFLKKKVKKLFRLPANKIQGRHNTENILAAVLIAVLLGADIDSIRKSISEFTPLRHRFQSVASIGGVEFIDDSKATNVDAARRALESLKAKAILIAGGKDKKLSYKKILPLLKSKTKKIILIGETKTKMKKVFCNIVPCEECASMTEAVFAAYKSAKKSDKVLLSPMCSSFDMFSSYKARGEAFCRAVENLKNAKD